MQSQIFAPAEAPATNQPITRRQSARFPQPKKQEWAIIYNQQAEQFKRQKQMQKQFVKEKQEQFRFDLEQQLKGKNNFQENDKQEDLKYSEYIKSKVMQENQREKMERTRKLLQRRRIQNENLNKIHAKQQSRVSQNTGNNNGVGLDIGDKPVQQKKIEEYYKRKSLTDALDQQMHMKQQQRKQQRQSELKNLQENQKYLNDYYNRREATGPKRRQNSQVYQYFQKINQQKMRKQRELQKKLVDQVIRQKNMEEAMKQDDKRRKKQAEQQQVKKVLSDQVRYRSQQNLNQKKYNPQDNSYQIIGGIFKQKRNSYDKRQYYQYLARQAEEQAIRKKQWDYMDEHEYRLNMNQLNKAVNGSYVHENYIDRSVNSIGHAKNRGASMSFDLGSKLPNDDNQINAVKNRLDEIRQKSGEKYINGNASFNQ